MALLKYLRKALNQPGLNYRADLEPLPGGYETAVFRFQLKNADALSSQVLVLRLYPKFYGDRNAIWESTIQNVLACEGYPVAKVHLVCSDLKVLGGAFFIMDYIPGKPLLFASPADAPEILGKCHAELHDVEPASLINALKVKGVNPSEYALETRFMALKNKAVDYPWCRKGVQWLLENRPPETERKCVCHSDFHPLNLLADEKGVTGVLDWSGFVIADPVFDVANTLVLMTIPVKHLGVLPQEVAPLDWDSVALKYLSSYQESRELDTTNLDFFQVRRCLHALIQGHEGQKVWKQPLIIRELTDYIQQKTGLKIKLPV